MHNLMTNAGHWQIAPYLTLLLHGAGWAQGFPRLISNEQLAVTLDAARAVGTGRFTCVGDISCDVEVRSTFISQEAVADVLIYHRVASNFYRGTPRSLHLSSALARPPSPLIYPT